MARHALDEAVRTWALDESSSMQADVLPITSVVQSAQIACIKNKRHVLVLEEMTFAGEHEIGLGERHKLGCNIGCCGRVLGQWRKEEVKSVQING